MVSASLAVLAHAEHCECGPIWRSAEEKIDKSDENPVGWRIFRSTGRRTATAADNFIPTIDHGRGNHLRQSNTPMPSNSGLRTEHLPVLDVIMVNSMSCRKTLNSVYTRSTVIHHRTLKLNPKKLIFYVRHETLLQRISWTVYLDLEPIYLTRGQIGDVDERKRESG